MNTITIKNLSEIDAAAQEFIGILKAQYPDSRCIVFNAGMGVGKTTFIKALSKAMGAVDEASSPTFSIVNDYLCEDGGHIFHFDLYTVLRVASQPHYQKHNDGNEDHERQNDVYSHKFDVRFVKNTTFFHKTQEFVRKITKNLHICKKSSTFAAFFAKRRRIN